MGEGELEEYLHLHIPLTAAMGVRVVSVGEAGISLAAPLAPNINHRQTAFGGSLATLAILSGWAWVQTRLRAAGIAARIVIQRETVDYLAPAIADFTAFCPSPPPAEWERFLVVFARRGKARLTLTATLTSNGVLAATFTGEFVAVAHETTTANERRTEK
jgi:thioesterase domain-containing protein